MEDDNQSHSNEFVLDEKCLTEELAFQKIKSINHLLQNISKLSSEVEANYLNVKWFKNPHSENIISHQVLTGVKSANNSNEYENTLQSLKLNENELSAIIAQKMTILKNLNGS